MSKKEILLKHLIIKLLSKDNFEYIGDFILGSNVRIFNDKVYSINFDVRSNSECYRFSDFKLDILLSKNHKISKFLFEINNIKNNIQ